MLRRLHPDQPEGFAFTQANQAWAISLAAFFGFTACAVPVFGSPANHVGKEMKAIMVERGCRMLEEDLAIAMRNAGHPISDYQSQVIALWRGGYMSAPSPKELQLINWGECA
ncbi:MAG: hypothetical protein AAGL49_08895 [Pseudomonadota bacterium]